MTNAGGLPDIVDLDAPKAPQDLEFDSIEEVDAVARSLRRVAIEYAALIIGVLLLVPLLSLVAEWWFARPVLGGLTFNFMTVALGLHLAFIAVAILYTRIAHRSEDEMLGRLESGEDSLDV
ncbi:MAG: hypothetical protein ACRDJS_08785 [Actinomycetota bacterium]